MSDSPPAHSFVQVDLGARSYRVEVGGGLLKSAGTQINQHFPDRKKVAVLTDSIVGPLYASTVVESLRATGKEVHLITVASGESSKSLGTAQTVCGEMVRAGLDRKSFLVALGGGVIGDLGGFCAAIFQRGIPYVQVPTTVLSQVDSSVGGKTGVNLPDAKNMVGSFHQPALVLADIDSLASLPKREFNEGFAEIIKHGCIRDAAMIVSMELTLSGKGELNLTELIQRNIAIKAAVVQEDEFETIGTRALLNFGHTLGHAIEAAAGYGTLLHGEAISLGLRAAAWLSHKKAGLPLEDYHRIIELLAAFDLPVRLGSEFENETLLRIARMDKKYEAGSIRFVLLRALGDAFVSKEITEVDLIAALDELRQPPAI